MDSMFLNILGAVALLLLLGIPLIMMNIRIAAQLHFKEIHIDGDRRLDQEFFRKMDKFASRRGYARQLDVSVIGLAGENFNRLYISGDGSSILATQMFAQSGDIVKYFEFCTKYDEVEVCANNAQISDLLYQPPWSHVVRRPDISDPEVLMSLHRQACAKYGRGAIRRVEASQFGPIFQESNSRNMDYQVERGILKKDSTGQWYSPTAKLALRGVGNYLNPVRDNFTWRRVAFGYVGAVALAAAGWACFILDAASHVEVPLPLDDSMVNLLLLGLGHILGGVVIGLGFGGKSFVWSILAVLPCFIALSITGVASPEMEYAYLFLTLITMVASHGTYNVTSVEGGVGQAVLAILEIGVILAVWLFLPYFIPEFK